MKSKYLPMMLVGAVLSSCSSHQREKMSDLERYGQQPPGIMPEKYQPHFGFLEGFAFEQVYFSPDGRELCFTVRDSSSREYFIYYMNKKEYRWSKPEIAYFIPSDGIGTLLQYSHDGNRIIHLDYQTTATISFSPNHLRTRMVLIIQQSTGSAQSSLTTWPQKTICATT